LLDTHPLLWWLGGGSGLRDGERDAIADPANEIAVSAASIWEAEIKSALGKLVVEGGDLLDQVRSAGFHLLDITPDDAVTAARLPPLHGDPFDRMLIAQAQRRELTLVTRDSVLGSYGVPTLA
jgi:PIN domain nuclease of toxin-antitoxin system